MSEGADAVATEVMEQAPISSEAETEALGRLLQERRSSATDGTSASGAPERVEVVVPAPGTQQPVEGEPDELYRAEAQQCARCPRHFTVAVIKGKRYPRPTGLCDDCEAQRLNDEAEAARQVRVGFRAVNGQAEYVERLKGFGVSDPRLWRCSLDNFDASDSPEALEAARSFVRAVLAGKGREGMRWLFLTGPTGNGKTHLLIGIDRALWVAGYDRKVILDLMPAFVRRVQQSYSRNPGRADALIQQRIDCDVWLCDDLGRGKQSADAVRIANEIGCERTMRPTAWTSNYLRTGLAERHDDYETLVSRLGPASCRTVEMKGRDRRDDQLSAPALDEAA